MQRHAGYTGFLVFAIAGLCLIALAADLAPARNDNLNSRPWLTHFAGGPVKVTFAEQPPDLEHVAKAVLVYVEQGGLVLRFPEQKEKFYPYANIISIEPI